MQSNQRSPHVIRAIGLTAEDMKNLADGNPVVKEAHDESCCVKVIPPAKAPVAPQVSKPQAPAAKPVEPVKPAVEASKGAVVNEEKKPA